MVENEKLGLKDIPTLEELQSRFANRERFLTGKTDDPSKVMRARSEMAYRFIYENMGMLEQKDVGLVSTAGRKISQVAFGALAAATLSNIYLGKITGNRIFDLNFALRASTRAVLFVVPFSFASDYGFRTYTRVTMYLTDKYLERVEKFMKVGDPRIINPFLEVER